MKADEILPFVRYIRYLDTTPDAVFETRTAYDARMFYAVSGKGGITADETEYVMNESDALIIAPGIPYKISPPKKGTAKYIAVNFDFTQDFSHLKTPIPPARTPGFDKNSILQSGKFEDFDGLNSVLHIPNIKRIEKNLAKAEYEKPLELTVHGRRVTFYPDFTVMNSRTGRIYYLEHFGMMDNEDYYNAVLRKLDAFEMNQLLIGRDVLLLHESSSAPLNTRVLDCYIQEYLV